MTVSHNRDTKPSTKQPPLLRRHVYDAMATAKGLGTVTAQAEHHGVRRPYWSEIHNGRRSPSFKLAMHVARQFGVPVNALWSVADE